MQGFIRVPRKFEKWLIEMVEKEKPNTHGGPRENSGRPKKDDAKKAYSTKLSLDVIAFLQSTDNAAATIETSVRNSKAYKLWKKSKA